ncbi:MAG TPA: Na+/H+ antiporter subunit C [bacterium]|nr:Na+/H+ antiporter subunit C [bacterium]HDP97905.1 Na+/H+ antiporter subunit C [bacterium]
MDIILAFLIGLLYAAGIYSMLRRSFIKLVIGLLLLSQATNLLIFTAGGLTRAVAPLVPDGEKIPPALSADPLPQALILTAIVISFGVLAFMLVLLHRSHQTIGSDDLDKMKGTDE